MPGRQQIPSFQMARGSTNERDTQTEVGSIFYNTDTSNVEVYHVDLSNNVGWRDLVMNNKEQIDISGDLYVGGGDIYGNGQLDFYTATNAANSIGWFELRQDKTIMGGDNIQFRTGSTTSVSGTERMRILSNGNVGINETAPTDKLHVAGNIKCSGNIVSAADNTTSRSEFGITAIGYIGHGNAAGFSHIDRATATDYAFVQTASGTTYVNAASGRQILFRCNNDSANLMVISSNGNVGINDSAPSQKLDVIGNIIATGNITPGSDDRIKTNEKLIVNATETLSKLTPQIYDKYLNMDLSGSFQVESGLIAQEVYYNAPELRHLVRPGKDTDASGNQTTPTPDEMDLSGVDIGSDPDYGSHGWSIQKPSSLNYNGLIAYLIKSNQEMAERLAALENK